MLLRFGPYSRECQPLTKEELCEIGVTQKFLDTYLVPFLEYLIHIRIEAPVHGIIIAKDTHWKPDQVAWKRDANIKKLRRAAWYLGIPVGSVCVGKSSKDGYYYPLNAAEFQPTIDQYKGRFFAFCKTVPHLAECQASADIFAAQIRGVNLQVIQTQLFTFDKTLEIRA